MRLYPENLKQQLQQGPAPCYLIVGDEALQRRECIDLLRQFANKHAYETGIRFSIEKGFDWQLIYNELNERSLFSDKRLIELEFINKPEQSSTKQLQHLAQYLSSEHIIVLTLPKLSAAQLKSKWFSNLESKGIYLPAQLPDKTRFPTWMAKRLKQHGLQAEAKVIEPLCYHFEGNLVAAEQAIIRLKMSYPQQKISTQQVLDSLSLEARFNAFQLVDSLMLGQQQQAQTILRQLQAEGIEAIIIAWSINRELLLLLKVCEGLQQGQALGSLYKSNGIWQQRQGGFNTALQRLNLKKISLLIQAAAKLDLQLKSQYPEDAFQQLSLLCDAFSGHDALIKALL